MIAAFEALRSEFRSAGAEGISLALVGDRKSTRLNSSHRT